MSTHFSSGVTNVDKDNQMAILRQPDPSVYYQQNFDFFSYTTGEWITTETSGSATQAIIDGAGGLLALTNTTGASDNNQIQWCGNAAAARLTTYWDQTKDLIIKARFKVSDATNTAILLGVATVDTTLAASLPTDGIYFYKASAATALIASTRKTGASSSIALGDMANDTFVEVALTYSGTNMKWTGWANNLNVGSISDLTNSPSNGLCLSIALLNASGVAHVLTTDYINVMVRR